MGSPLFSVLEKVYDLPGGVSALVAGRIGVNAKSAKPLEFS